jgi:hypothetical protein
MLGRSAHRLPSILSVCLPERLARGTFGILALAAWAAFFGEVARFHDGAANFAGGEAHIRGMAGPGQVSPMKVAAVAWIKVEVGERSQQRQLWSPCPYRGADCLAYGIAGQGRFHFSDEDWRLTIDPSAGLQEPRKGLQARSEAPVGFRIGEAGQSSKVTSVGTAQVTAVAFG